MGLSISTLLAVGTDRGSDRTHVVEHGGPGDFVRGGAHDPDRPHPVSGHEPTGVRERVARSGGGTP